MKSIFLCLLKYGLLITLLIAWSCNDPTDQATVNDDKKISFDELSRFMGEDQKFLVEKFGQPSSMKLFSVNRDDTNIFYKPATIIQVGEWDIISNHQSIIIGIVRHDENPYTIEVMNKLAERAENNNHQNN